MVTHCPGWEHASPFKFAGVRRQSQSTHHATYSLGPIRWRKARVATSGSECDLSAWTVPTLKTRHLAGRDCQRARIVVTSSVPTSLNYPPHLVPLGEPNRCYQP